MYLIALGLSVVCFIAVMFFYARSAAFSIFHPLTFYSAFHLLVFVVRPILAYAYDYNLLYYAYQFTPSMSDKVTVILASNLGFMVFAVACLFTGNAPMQFREDFAVLEERRRLTQIFVWVLVICGPPAIYSLASIYSTNAGIYDGLMLDRATGVAYHTKSSGYLSDLQLMAVSMSSLIIWLLRFRWYSFIPAIAFVVLRAGSGGRGPFIAALVTAGLFYLYEKRIRYPGVRMVLAVLALGAVFSAVGADRGQTVRQGIGLEQRDSPGVKTKEEQLRPLESMDFANMEFFEYLVYVIPQRSGTYDYFLDNVQVLTEPVPRALWTGKPIGEPFRRIQLFDFGFPMGMTRSLPGEGWYALGWLGVIIWCGLWGLALGSIYRRFATGTQTTFQTAAYCVFLPTLIVAFRDGQLLTLVKQTGAFFAPIGVWYLLARYFGVPRARDLANLVKFRQRQASGTAAEPQPRALSAPEPLVRAAATLPPAVRRRRLLLTKERLANPGG